MIIAFLGESIKIYRENFVTFLSDLELSCPLCMSKTHWHCWYKRSVKGEKDKIPILRVKCSGCSKTHAVLPDFLAPYKHYSQITREEILEKVVENNISVEHVDPSPQDKAKRPWPAIETMRLWVRSYREKERQLIGAVAGFLERHGLSVGPWKRGFAFFKHLITLAERLLEQTICGSCTLGKTNIILTISKPGLWI